MPTRPASGSRWGTARVAVLTLRAEIGQDLAVGMPVAEIYRRHKDRLPNITAGAFARQVRLLLKAHQSPPTPQPKDAGPTHAGHQSSLTRTFGFEAEAKPGERDKLVGPPRNK